MESAKPLLNNRYQKVKRLGEGAYGSVYLAIDMKPEGGVRRGADPRALEMLQAVKEQRSVDDVKMTDEEDKKQQEALKVLSDKAQVFQNNEVFAHVEISAKPDQPVYVAIKKIKMNQFNVSTFWLNCSHPQYFCCVTHIFFQDR